MKKIFIVLFVLFFVAATTHAQDKGKMAIGAQGGVAIPMGDFADGFDFFD